MLRTYLKGFSALSLLTLMGVSLFSQGKILSLEDAVLNTKLNPKTLGNVAFLPSGNYFSYAKENTLYIEKVDKLITDSSLTLDAINKALQKAEEAKLNRLPHFTWLNDNEFICFHAKKRYHFEREPLKLVKTITLPDSAETPEWNSTFSSIAFTKNHNLYLYNQGKVIAITDDGRYGISYGLPAHRNEFGISKGIFWSPDSRKIAFYKIDEREVTDFFTFQNDMKPAGVSKLKYPFAGTTNQKVTIGIYDLDRQSIHYLKTGTPADQYLSNITWSPDSRYIYLAKVSRNQQNMWLEKYWVNDGSLDFVLSEEYNEKYVEPQHGISFLPWQTDHLVWQSQKDGYNHIYLFNTVNGKLIKQLTTGPWLVTKIIGYSPDTEHILIEGTKDGPLERHIYAVSVASGKIRKITQAKGYHQVITNKNGNFFLDAYSSLNIPYKLDFLSETGALLRNLQESPNPLNDYILGETSLFPLQNGSTTLYARMIKPIDFDPKKQYPVVIYVYGGPHVQLVKNNWLGGSNLWMQYLAQQGYIVFTLDNRGSAYRGFAFESAIHGNLGEREMEDQLAGVAFLKSQSFVDPNRIALHGWSFGGFMTTSLMSRTKDIFKVGVAGGPVIDWSMYEIMYTERYMRTPQTNPEGFKKSNLLQYADKLNGKLLMIHGTDDDVVLWQHSLLYVQKNMEAGNTQLDYLVYPTHKHNVYGKDRLHLMTKITDYIFDNL